MNDANESSPTAPATLKATSFVQLLDIVRAPKTVHLQFGQSAVEIEVRALTEKQWAEVNRIGADLKAPPKYKDREKKVPDGYDEEDPDYVKAATEAFELRRTQTLVLGLVSLEFPQTSLETQHAWRRENLPPQVVDALYAAIRSLTSDPVALAHFTTSAS